MLRSTRLALLVLPALVLGAGCRRQRPAAPPPAPATTPPANDDAAERARRDAEAREAARRAEEARLQAAREAADRERAATRATLEATVYFGYDRSDLDASARSALDAKLPLLQASPDLRLRIAGHTDDRGSDEYNLALGQRRAAAVKRFLSQHGIDEGRLEIASLGEEHGVCADMEEGCWTRNRRATFEITAGTIALTTGTSAPGR